MNHLSVLSKILSSIYTGHPILPEPWHFLVRNRSDMKEQEARPMRTLHLSTCGPGAQVKRVLFLALRSLNHLPKCSHSPAT